MKGGIISDETDWMAVKRIEIVGPGNANKEGLFAEAAPEHPAMVRAAGPAA